jgi:pimeloyl-ACP methyl ester carboxylesterase
MLRAGVVEAMYRQDLTRSLPGVLATIAGGDRTPVDHLVDEVAPLPQTDVDASAEGTRQIVTCADQGDGDTATDQELLTEAGAWARRLLFHVAFCDVWRVRTEPLSPVVGDVPVLAYAGEFDPVQPVDFTEETTAGLTNRTVVEVPGGGHRNAFSDSCTQSITLAFFADPTAEADLTCIEQIPQPFSTP